MKRLLFAIVSLTVSFFPHQTRTEEASGLQALPVVLKEKATITDDYIRLGDLFSGLDEEKDKKAVAPAPALGKEAILTSEWLGKLARSHNIAWKSADTKISVTVRRDAEEISKEEIARVIVKELKTQGMPDNTELAFQTGDFPVLTPVKALWHLTPVSAEYIPARQQFKAKLSLTVDGGKTKEMSFSGKAKVFVTVPVAAHDLKTGRIITSDDLLTTRVPQENIKDADPVKTEDLIGKEIKKSVKAGQRIAKNDIRSQVMVAKGKIVTLNFTKGGIMLSAQGKAVENGGLGDTVRVMNLQSKSVVQGIVTGPETVSINVPGKQP